MQETKVIVLSVNHVFTYTGVRYTVILAFTHLLTLFLSFNITVILCENMADSLSMNIFIAVCFSEIQLCYVTAILLQKNCYCSEHSYALSLIVSDTRELASLEQ